jgi:MFS transporter, AAHS family, 4-hydroxybenzoate transporter
MTDSIHYPVGASRSTSRLQVVTLILCFVIVGLDGFAMGTASYVAPVLRGLWFLDSGTLGTLLSAGFLGLAIGSFVWGPIADEFGRKRVVILSMMIFGVASLCAAFSPTVNWLIGLRFVTGLGLGGAFPNAITLATEFCPRRNKAMLVTIVLLALPGGLALSGLIASISIPAFGWKSLFILGGFFPLLLIPVVWLFLPESLQFVRGRGRVKGSVAAEADKPEAKPVLALFDQGAWRGTTILWLTLFCSMWAYYQVTNWLPVLVTGVGIGTAHAASIAALFPFGGLIGSLVVAHVMEKCNRYAVLAAYSLLAAIFTGGIGLWVHSPQLLASIVFCAGIALGGVQPGLVYIVAHYYRDEVRATGVAWGLGVGRLGSVVGAATGGAVLAWMQSIQRAFFMFALPVLIAGLGMVLMMWLSRTRLSLESGASE